MRKKWNLRVKNQCKSIDSNDFKDDGMIAIGKIIKPHGLKGEVKVYPFTNIEELFEEKEGIFLVNPRNNWRKQIKIERLRRMNKLLILKMEGYDYRNDVERLRGYEIRLDKNKLPKLNEWEYYVFQLLECDAFYGNGIRIGKIVDVIETGSNDVIVVRNEEGKEELFPMIRDYILKFDLRNKKVVVKKIEWYEGNEE